MGWRELYNKWKEFKGSTHGMRIIRVVRIILFVAVVSYLVHNLMQVGWNELSQNLPEKPLFYLIFLFLYFSLPISEQLIYRIFWKFEFWSGFRAFITKKVLNQDVVGYSGEVFLYSWAKRKIHLPDRKIAGIIKDNNIISSVCSTLTAISLLIYFAYVADTNILKVLHISENHLYIAFGLILIIILALWRYRSKVISIPSHQLAKVYGIHQTRILLNYAIEILQWSIILPGVPLYVWFTILSAKIISSRIPFIPSQDLLFAGLGVEISRWLNVSTAGVAGILLTNVVLGKLLNAGLFFAFQINKAAKSGQEIALPEIATEESTS